MRLTGAAIARVQDFENEPKARQAQFRIMAQTLGVLGGTARGKVDHDTETARLVAKYRRDIGAFLKTLQPVSSGGRSARSTRQLGLPRRAQPREIVARVIG